MRRKDFKNEREVVTMRAIYEILTRAVLLSVAFRFGGCADNDTSSKDSESGADAGDTADGSTRG